MSAKFYRPLRKPEPLALTLLTALTALLSSLLLGLVFVGPVLAFSDSNAEMREIVEARKPAEAQSSARQKPQQQQLADARRSAPRPLPR